MLCLLAMLPEAQVNRRLTTIVVNIRWLRASAQALLAALSVDFVHLHVPLTASSSVKVLLRLSAPSLEVQQLDQSTENVVSIAVIALLHVQLSLSRRLDEATQHLLGP